MNCTAHHWARAPGIDEIIGYEGQTIWYVIYEYNPVARKQIDPFTETATVDERDLGHSSVVYARIADRKRSGSTN